MKIAESMMIHSRSSEIEALNGEVEAVEMSDPERACFA
jgi:hypothetical protein